MNVGIVYHDNVAARVRVGEWAGMPDDDVQIVNLYGSDGTDVLSGFDFYFLNGRIVGGYYTEPRPWANRGVAFRWMAGAWEFLGEIPAYEPGTVPRVAQGGSIKAGRLIDDDKAEALGLSIAWRPYLAERLRELGIGP